MKMKLVIYGAPGYALAACEAIKPLYPKREIACFLVTHMSNNAPVLGGIPVRELSAYAQEMGMEEKRETEVLIATPEQIQAEIEETLELWLPPPQTTYLCSMCGTDETVPRKAWEVSASFRTAGGMSYALCQNIYGAVSYGQAVAGKRVPAGVCVSHSGWHRLL